MTAIDISPLPPRSLPPNIRFVQLDVTEPLPFLVESFDIIHARLVFMYLPNWKRVLENIVSFLKPQGWLWIEEGDLYLYDDGPQGLGPSVQLSNNNYLAYLRSKNVNALFASFLGSSIKELVNDIGIKCPTNGKDNDPSIQAVGQALYTSFHRASMGSTTLKWNAAGITPEPMDGVFRETEDPSWSVYFNQHMTWSQKK